MKQIRLPAALAACAAPQASASAEHEGQAMHEQTVRMGSVESVCEVILAGRNSGAGSMGGALIGSAVMPHVGRESGSSACVCSVRPTARA